MKNKKKAIVCVSNDLITDNRVAKTCLVLKHQNYEVILVGRKKKNSPSMNERAYISKRFKLPFEKGPFFYLTLNIRLFLFLMWQKADLIYSNDLDTLSPCFVVSKIKNTRLIYDTHELFTEVPELTGRPRVRNVWLKIESTIFPKLKHVITVNDSIARIYMQKYNVAVTSIRNIPVFHKDDNSRITRKELELREDDFILIIQGSGLNKDRGIEEAVYAMQYCTDCVLLLVGDGDMIPKAKEIVAEYELEQKVRFISRRPYKELMKITRIADLGLLLDKNTSLNQELALPNKLFDYMHGGVPILSSDLTEITKIIKQYEIGVFLAKTEPKTISETILRVKGDSKLRNKLKKNCLLAAEKENWKIEQLRLVKVILSAEQNEA
jgi:glycosyltransferase involved in cell wall biosynthesis